MEKTKKTKKSLVGENITRAIKRLGYRSVEAFAEDNGLVLPTLQGLIHGQTNGISKSLKNTAKALGVEPWELLKPPESTDDVRTVAEPANSYQATPIPDPDEIAALILAYGNAESSLRSSIRRQLGLEKSDQDREAFERHALSYREQRDKLQIKDRKGE